MSKAKACVVFGMHSNVPKQLPLTKVLRPFRPRLAKNQVRKEEGWNLKRKVRFRQMTAMSWSSTTWSGRMPAVADLVWMTSTSCPRMMKDGRVKVVGRNCVAPDRPGIQYVVHSLAGFMKEPTKAEQRLCLYFKGPATKELVWWRWIRNQHAECWPPSEWGGAVDTSCDADHAGNRATRKSISSVQIYLDGIWWNPMSVVEERNAGWFACQIRQLLDLWQHVLVYWTCPPHWSQLAVATELNPADSGTKSLSKARVRHLKYIIKIWRR